LCNNITFISSFPTEDFNKKILNPDLSQQDLEKLHGDLCELYRNYLAPNAPDRIHFDESIVTEIQESKYNCTQWMYIRGAVCMPVHCNMLHSRKCNNEKINSTVQSQALLLRPPSCIALHVSFCL